jgi:putative transposase
MSRFARVIPVEVPAPPNPAAATRGALSWKTKITSLSDLLQQSTELQGIALIGYCLMSNHIHLVAVPRKASVLAHALKETHGRFASYWNAPHHSTGHIWHGRYYSCLLGEPHLREKRGPKKKADKSENQETYSFGA